MRLLLVVYAKTLLCARSGLLNYTNWTAQNTFWLLLTVCQVHILGKYICYPSLLLRGTVQGYSLHAMDPSIKYAQRMELPRSASCDYLRFVSLCNWHRLYLSFRNGAWPLGCLTPGH